MSKHVKREREQDVDALMWRVFVVLVALAVASGVVAELFGGAR
jgi:hypothetical protein